MGFTERDERFMRTALALAEQGRGWVEPNPVVGAVIVRDGRIVGEGAHCEFGGAHAELRALAQARDLARGATLYVTLEPCAHQGKTPPCAPQVAEAGIQRLVAATVDPTDKTRGKGMALCREAGMTVEAGLCREEAIRQNAAFFKRAAVGRPLVVAKWAMSADGRIATRSGDSNWISCENARALVHVLRGQVDCIAVGDGTVNADNPLLTSRARPLPRVAARLVVCGGEGVPLDCRLVSTASEAPVLLAYPDGMPPEGLEGLLQMGCTPLPLPATQERADRLDLAAMLDELGRREMSALLVEGGGGLLGAFFDARLVDRVMIFVAPTIMGGSGAVCPVAGRGVAEVRNAPRILNWSWRSVEDDALIEGWLVDPLEWAP